MKPIKQSWLFIFLVVTSCSISAEHQSWSFIEEAGGISVSLDEGENALTIECGVGYNSGLMIKKIGKKFEDNNIQIYVVTQLVKEGYIPDMTVDISSLPNGDYRVEYLNPDGTTHFIKNINIKR